MIKLFTSQGELGRCEAHLPHATSILHGHWRPSPPNHPATFTDASEDRDMLGTCTCACSPDTASSTVWTCFPCTTTLHDPVHNTIRFGTYEAAPSAHHPLLETPPLQRWSPTPVVIVAQQPLVGVKIPPPVLAAASAPFIPSVHYRAGWYPNQSSPQTPSPKCWQSAAPDLSSPEVAPIKCAPCKQN